MNSAGKLEAAMRSNRVYRRQDLERFSTAVDRNLKNLVKSGVVKKLSGGLYYRPLKNVFGAAPPNERDLVRAFLKTDNFLITSYNNYNQLGLGLSQIYNFDIVYNHRRTGRHELGGKRFDFRIVPEYPRKLSKEYILVDLLNNFARLPDNTSSVFDNLKSRQNYFNLARLHYCVKEYAKPRAKKMVKELYD